MSDESNLKSPACGTQTLPSPPFPECWVQKQAPLPTDHLAGFSYKILLSMFELERGNGREGEKERGRQRQRQREGEREYSSVESRV